MNIKFEYLYRDSGNYKNWGEVIFSNPESISVDFLTENVQSILIDKIYFFAQEALVPDLHFKNYDMALDHGWHEFNSFSETDEAPTDTKSRNVDDFLKTLMIASGIK